jgi:broad specificity phosphatase PhoE
MSKEDLLKPTSVPSCWNLNEVYDVNPFDETDEGYDFLKDDSLKKAVFLERVASFLLYLVKESSNNNYKNILIVAHHDWIAAAFKILEEKVVSLENCGLAEFYLDV